MEVISKWLQESDTSVSLLWLSGNIVQAFMKYFLTLTSEENASFCILLYPYTTEIIFPFTLRMLQYNNYIIDIDVRW